MDNLRENQNLTDLRVGQKAKITGFRAGSQSYRQKVLAMGLTPGVTLEVSRRAPLGDPIELRLRGYSLSLRKKECACVFVEPLQ